MAIPKVFVSSTCYDLQEERAQLERFISNYGFHPILSEHSGIYYSVDAHTHDSCVAEVSHCDMFVLIISGRYGGKFKDGNGESITHAEYNRARELELPIFTFVKSDVYAAQHYYKENVRAHNEEFASKINYPAIQQQNDAVSIFSFIDSVHRSSTNNGIETYQSFSDIENHLKKQWAGMFFSFLQKRKEVDKVEAMASILDKLAGSSSKLEVLVSSLHDKEVGKDQTSKLIEESNQYKDCLEFYTKLLQSLDSSLWIMKGDIKAKKDYIVKATQAYAVQEPKEKLEDFLKSLPNLDFSFTELSNGGITDTAISFNGKESAALISGFEWLNLTRLYENTLKDTPESTRVKAYKESLEKYLSSF